MRPLRYPLTVFYDASCPLCASEVHALRDLDTAGRLELVDCSAPDFDDAFLLGDGIRREHLMARMHVRDAHGRWLRGLDAFEAMYRAAGLEAAARLWGSPKWRPLFDRVYPWIARHRQALSRLGLQLLVRRLIPRPSAYDARHALAGTHCPGPTCDARVRGHAEPHP